ncbi:MAG: retention module-containing protein, partial [Gammaproteobacteria bacterium]
MVANIQTIGVKSGGSQPIGMVTSASGTVTATSINGIERTLQVGDPIYANETINTGPLSTVAIEFINGTRLDLGRDSQAVLDEEVFHAAGEGVADAASTVEAIQQAILAGKDPTDLFEKPAAGENAVFGAEGENSLRDSFIVQIDRINQHVTPESGLSERDFVAPAIFSLPSPNVSFFAVPEPTPAPAPAPAPAPNNTAPIAGNVTASGNEDTLIPVTLSGSDADGMIATVTLIGLPANGLLYTDVALTTLAVTGIAYATDGNTLVFYFTPDANYNGTVSFDYTVTDNNGTTNATPTTATITVNPVNDAPVITSNGGNATATVNVAENSTAVTTVTADDVDGPALIYGIVGGADAALFNINASTGALSFINAPDFENPTDSGSNNIYDVIVQVSDGSQTDTQAISVTVTNINEVPPPVNNAPVANNDTLAATEDTQVTYTAADLLGNDTDVEGNPLSIATVTSGVGGTVVLNGNGTVTFTPSANFNGAASFSYIASDGITTSNSATVTINVAAVNDAPTTSAVTLSARAEDSGALTITQAQLLANAADI